MKQLTLDQMNVVAGGDLGEAAVSLGAGGAIGAAAFGSSWGMAGVGIAFAVSPLAVVAMAAAAGYAGYKLGEHLLQNNIR